MTVETLTELLRAAETAHHAYVAKLTPDAAFRENRNWHEFYAGYILEHALDGLNPNAVTASIPMHANEYHRIKQWLADVPVSDQTHHTSAIATVDALIRSNTLSLGDM